jgi:prolyl-tRNA editing enzyme YbaK/EbsC (Cys-tRNA(Pro) deacylase)
MALSASARKVQEALQAHGITCQVLELSETARSAKEAARAIGCGVEQIVKSLVFRSQQTHRPILVVASGGNRVNEQTLSTLIAEPIEKADAAFVRQQTGFAIGGVPPVGHAQRLVTFIDEDLLQYDQIWAAAGTPNAVFPLTPADLQRLTQGQVVRIT